MDLGIKRLILVVVSIAGGIGGLYGLLFVLNLAYGHVSLRNYDTIYAVLTAVPFALLVAVWLDYFMGTRLLGQEDPHAGSQTPAAEEKK